MTNEQSQKADGFEDIMARYRAFQERRAELFVVNKAKMFETLAVLGITSILVRFDGYGDSGQIEEIDAVMGEVPTELPDIGIEMMVTNHGADRAFAEVQPLRQALETLCYSLLTRTHDGWENNDGAYGEFVLTTATATIALDFNYRVTETEHHDHIF